MHDHVESVRKGRQPLTEELPESMESTKFVSHRAKMSREFVSFKERFSINKIPMKASNIPKARF